MKGKKTGGRKRGSLNKTTVSVKQVFEEAFDGLGGTKALVKWAKAEPTEFYKLYAKLIPQDINAKHGLTDSLAALIKNGPSV